MLNPWVLLGAVVAGIALFGGGWWTGSKVESAGWEEREREIQTKAVQQTKDSYEKLLANEHAAAQSGYEIAADYENQLHTRRVTLDNALTNGGQLFVNAKCPDAGPAKDGVAAPASVGDGSQRAELSAKDSEFLRRIGAEADDTVIQLTAAQALIEAQRKACR